jgi:hypothetical protein
MPLLKKAEASKIIAGEHIEDRQVWASARRRAAVAQVKAQIHGEATGNRRQQQLLQPAILLLWRDEGLRSAAWLPLADKVMTTTRRLRPFPRPAAGDR